jgi:hypothetical protein
MAGIPGDAHKAHKKRGETAPEASPPFRPLALDVRFRAWGRFHGLANANANANASGKWHR